jgi:hypothetical protein
LGDVGRLGLALDCLAFEAGFRATLGGMRRN